LQHHLQGHRHITQGALLFVPIVIRLWLLLLLDYVLLLRRPMNQRGSTRVFVGMFGKYQPSLRHIQDCKPSLTVRGSEGNFNALRGVRAIQLGTAGR
jgi:hypothetical protein